MMEFIPNPHKIEHPAGVHMLDNQSRITLWQTEPAALLYAQMLQGCLREYAGLEVPFTRGKPGQVTPYLRWIPPCRKTVTR